MVTNVYLLDKLEGYNPPNFYLTIDSNAKATAIKTKFSAGKSYLDVKHSIENRYGRALIPITTDLESIQARGYSVIYIEHNNDYKYIGLINSFSLVSPNVMQITYTIDWFTSQILTSYLIDASYRYNPLLPKAKVVHYKRKSDGEFDYIDDGFRPTVIKKERVTGAFLSSPQYALLVYNCSANNEVYWILGPLSTGSPQLVEFLNSPANMWEKFFANNGFTSPETFDPTGILFFGYINLPLDALPHYGNGPHYSLRRYVGVIGGDSGYVVHNNQFATATDVSLNAGISGMTYRSTDYSKYKLVDVDGVDILEFPEGVDISTITVDIFYADNPSNPSVVFKLKDNIGWQAPSFTVAFKPITTFQDSEQIYYAEERVYAQETRSLQAKNELASGLMGAANQGAMISAFSRTQIRSEKLGKSNALNKGVVGGLVAGATSVGQYAYSELYANKQAQEIEDRYQKLKPDTLILVGGVDYHSDIGGLYCYKYDDDTIANITAYQSEYGYATNRVATNVNLNTLSGYVEADILMDGGLNTTIQTYILDMFNYGITFNEVTIEG